MNEAPIKTEIIDKLALIFNELEHLDKPELSKEIQRVIALVEIYHEQNFELGFQVGWETAVNMMQNRLNDMMEDESDG